MSWSTGRQLPPNTRSARLDRGLDMYTAGEQIRAAKEALTSHRLWTRGVARVT